MCLETAYSAFNWTWFKSSVTIQMLFSSSKISDLVQDLFNLKQTLSDLSKLFKSKAILSFLNDENELTREKKSFARAGSRGNNWRYLWRENCSFLTRILLVFSSHIFRSVPFYLLNSQTMNPLIILSKKVFADEWNEQIESVNIKKEPIGGKRRKKENEMAWKWVDKKQIGGEKEEDKRINRSSFEVNRDKKQDGTRGFLVQNNRLCLVSIIELVDSQKGEVYFGRTSFDSITVTGIFNVRFLWFILKKFILEIRSIEYMWTQSKQSSMKCHTNSYSINFPSIL